MRTFFLRRTVYALGFVAALISHLTPSPDHGDIITDEGSYGVDVEWLKNSNSHWGASSQSHRDAAQLLASKLSRSIFDDETSLFLDDASQRPLLQKMKYILFCALQRYCGWSGQEAFGFLSMSSLFVASSVQLQALVAGHHQLSSPARLFSVGSGGGSETAKLAKVLNVASSDVTCLETSYWLRMALAQRGFNVLDSVNEDKSENFSAAELSNVLDSVDDPAALLDFTLRQVTPGGLLIIATVLPFNAKVYEGKLWSKWDKAHSRKPARPLVLRARAPIVESYDHIAGKDGKQPKELSTIANKRTASATAAAAAAAADDGGNGNGAAEKEEGKNRTRRSQPPRRRRQRKVYASTKSPASSSPKSSFERRATIFLEAILDLQPQLRLTMWTRLPYISSGDTKQTHYVMDMAVMAFQTPGSSSSSTEEEEEDNNNNNNTANAAAALPSDDALEEEKVKAAAAAAAAAAATTTTTKSPPPSSPPDECKQRGGDEIYDWLAGAVTKEGLESWGQVLDAGTGFGSMCWLTHQPAIFITGVTATDDGRYGAADLQSAVAAASHKVEIVRGNWRSEAFMRGRVFDVVVCDYLLGATEELWPFGVDEMVDRVLAAVKPGGFLFIVGLEPYEHVLDRRGGFFSKSPSSSRDRLVLDVESLGHSAAGLAGLSTYRELPEAWVRRQIVGRRGAEFSLVAAKQFKMKLTAKQLRRQLSYASQVAAKIEDRGLREAYATRAVELEGELSRWSGTHTNGRNYALVVQRRA